jgi:hypothetical protein
MRSTRPDASEPPPPRWLIDGYVHVLAVYHEPVEGSQPIAVGLWVTLEAEGATPK